MSECGVFKRQLMKILRRRTWGTTFKKQLNKNRNTGLNFWVWGHQDVVVKKLTMEEWRDLHF